jgi:hypothetical protein
MRVLLIHPEDDLQGGPWNNSKWDRVVDLGQAGAQAYQLAQARFGCQINSLQSYRREIGEIETVRQRLGVGFGRLIDRWGLDWWELTSMFVHQQLEVVILLEALARTLNDSDEIFISRSSFHAAALRLSLGNRLQIFPPQRGRSEGRIRRYMRAAKKFPVGQLGEIFWDKNDTGYQIRGSVSRKRKPQDAPVVLLPTAYVNVSRTGIAYARNLPESRFLLVATRRSGWIDQAPPNVVTAWLRSYASLRDAARKLECAEMVQRWLSLRKELEDVAEFRTLARLGLFDHFPSLMAHGMEIRDAWRNVLDGEPVQSVLCADDSNPYTNLPLLLGKQRNLPTISCHHGALDGRCMFKRSHADVLLAKGDMEQDYLVRRCGLPREQIEIGAPDDDSSHGESTQGAEVGSAIVLFSEPYESMGGRAMDVYRDILPRLAELSLARGKELVIKLHPAESISERKRLVEKILSPEQTRTTRLMDGPLRSELLERTWFGITILSTVVVDCALRGIPCFLCNWLESSPYGYIDQFTRFGVGILLDAPEQVSEIPQLLARPRTEVPRENLWHPIRPERLRTLLGFARKGQSVGESQRVS